VPRAALRPAAAIAPHNLPVSVGRSGPLSGPFDTTAPSPLTARRPQAYLPRRMGILRRSQRMRVCFIYAFVLRRAPLMYVGKTFDRRRRERYWRRRWGELEFRVLDVVPPGENYWQVERFYVRQMDRWVRERERAGWKLLNVYLRAKRAPLPSARPRALHPQECVTSLTPESVRAELIELGILAPQKTRETEMR